MAIADFEIGLTEVGLVNVEDLTVPLLHPRVTPPLPSVAVPLASGRVRGAGWLVCVWTWSYLEQDQYNQLRTFCPGKSADVFIQTKRDDGVYDIYSAVMVWPDAPERTQNVYVDFDLEFINLEAT